MEKKKKIFKIKMIEIFKVAEKFKNRDPERKVVATPDMLRYDHCYACEDYPDLVAKLNGGRVTHDRWESFWQKLTFVETARWIDPDKWFTYVHNREHGLDKELLSNRKEYGQEVQVQFDIKKHGAAYK
jgi:hypothetical protein